MKMEMRARWRGNAKGGGIRRRHMQSVASSMHRRDRRRYRSAASFEVERACESGEDDNDAQVSLDSLIAKTRRLGNDTGLNVVAFSGGVDSSLVSYLVHRAFPRGHAAACVGKSASLSARQLNLARSIAETMDFHLLEVETNELENERYVKNDGDACLFCKRELYGTMEAIASEAKDELERRRQGQAKPILSRKRGLASALRKVFDTFVGLQFTPYDDDDYEFHHHHYDENNDSERRYRSTISGADATTTTTPSNDEITTNDAIIIFNGTNRDDLSDLTRLGITAATEFRVRSPLCDISKNRVRQLALEAGLPNHNLAAAPCLRSRLAYGVRATATTLSQVEHGEDTIRTALRLRDGENLRLRIMPDGEIIVEVDEALVPLARSLMKTKTIDARFRALGLCANEEPANYIVRAFRSGALSSIGNKQQQKYNTHVRKTSR